MQHARAQRNPLKSIIELLSSMRFAISLLVVLMIASIVGTLIVQNRPPIEYMNAFGPFWSRAFSTLGLYSVYEAGWFVTLCTFLLLSTTLCVIRQFKPLLHGMRGFREHAQEASLRAFAHHAELSVGDHLKKDGIKSAISGYLGKSGFRIKLDERDDGTLIAAKKGTFGRIGYFFAHGAIVLMCIGGIIDSGLPFSLQTLLNDKKPLAFDARAAKFPETAILGTDTLRFRGNVRISEGQTRDFALLQVDDGLFAQQLPFSITLKKYRTTFYENGMPKSYASDIIITDKATGKRTERTVEVNKPVLYRGISLFQNSFDNWGSKLHPIWHQLSPGKLAPTPIEAAVGASLKPDDAPFSIEFLSLNPINVGQIDAPADSTSLFAQFTRGAATASATRKLTNRGPSFSYRLKAADTGKEIKYINYMLPVEVEGQRFQVTTGQDSAGKFFRLYIPLDEKGSVVTWFAIKNQFSDPARREKVLDIFTTRVDSGIRAKMKDFLRIVFVRFDQGGIQGIASALAQVPGQQRESINNLIDEVLKFAVWDAWAGAREEAGLAPLEPDNDKYGPFLLYSLQALSDRADFGTSFFLQMNSFEETQSTVLEATRLPGKPLVYLGALMLVLGIFAMLYIRERRFFVLLKANQALVAMSSTRKTLEIDEQFAEHCKDINALLNTREAPATSSPTSASNIASGLRRRLTPRFTPDYWLYLALLLAGTIVVFLYYGDKLDVYDKGILLIHIPILAWFGWVWRPFRLFTALVALVVLTSLWLYQDDPTRADKVFLLKYLISSQTAISWMSALFFTATAIHWAGLLAGSERAARTGSQLTFTATIMGTVGLFVRWYESYLMPGSIGHIPISNMYEVLVLFSIITALIYLFYETRYGTRKLGAFVLVVISTAVLFMLYKSLQTEGFAIQPLVPALQSYWMKVHVPANFIGYGAFALATMAGVVYLLAAHGIGTRNLPTLPLLEDVMYKSISIGFIFFTIATVLGALWAAEAWGSYWSWDPKETWALIVWLNYAAWLHMRLTRNLRGKMLAWWAVIGLFVVTFAFVGVNLVLTGMHSYGSS